MKRDLDALMERRALDAFIVAGGEGENPVRTYLTNGAPISGGFVVKARGQAPLLVVNPMEIEEAYKSGLRVMTLLDLGWTELVSAHEGDRDAAETVIWGQMLSAAGAEGGTVGVYGRGELGAILTRIDRLRAALPAYRFVGEGGLDLFAEAAITKDADEIATLRAIAAQVDQVLAETWAFISGHRAADGIVVDAAGSPLTIGGVKRFVRQALLERDLEDTGMIFAQGRDAGFPHSRGDDAAPLRTHSAIVFDLFPRAIGGGYHHDVTRTWCIEGAPAEVQRAYDDVRAAFDAAFAAFVVDMPARDLQHTVQDVLEAAGHPTLRSHPGTTIGYAHSLGHGLGLAIHERPGIGHQSNDTLPVASVITIEPGVYYPDQGFGIRIEDTCVVDEAGRLIPLTTFHKTLILPL